MTEDKGSNAVDFQDASLDIWGTKYQLKDDQGCPVDGSPDDSYERVAKALASVEKDSAKKRKYKKLFMEAMKEGAIPAGRILSNCGAEKFKPATSTINCTVSGTVYDSMDDILFKNHEAGLTLKSGAGIGYEFSTLRPKGAYVSGAGANTSGPLSFMDIFDRMCFTVSSAGGRRGAQMATFDVHHPDVLEFIEAKREDGRLRQFNFSLLITDDFIEAVRNNDQWRLSFPICENELKALGLSLDDETHIVYREFPITDGYITNKNGEVACRVFRTIPARVIWDAIMTSTYDYAEPGFILIDEMNRMNNNWFCENIRASNPCGEQGLPPYGSCLLGSVNLTQFVEDAFQKSAKFNHTRFKQVVRIFTRMLDNVVELNNLPLEKQRQEIYEKRRHGMGILGLGSVFSMLGIKYGSDESVMLTNSICRDLAMAGWEEALELSKEKGPAPIMERQFIITNKMLRDRPELARDGYDVGDVLPGRVLHARYSRYMQKIREENPELVDELEKHGARFTHHSSIAPTGTISLSLANNASNGIEPSFSHHYARNIIREGRKTKEKVDVFSYELLAYRKLVNASAMPNAENAESRIPESFSVSDDVTPKQHVDIQAAAQKWIDSSISKTANIPTDYPYDDFKDIYLYAYDHRLKGCTTFRFNPEAFQGVLVKESDLENTLYEFTLDNGEKVRARGSETIIYDGEEHSVANLFDALKEGTYGKY